MGAKNTDPDIPGLEEHPLGNAPQRRLFILAPAPFTVIGTLAVVMGLYTYLPVQLGPSDGLTHGIRWAFVSSLSYVAMCLVILKQRLMEGAHDPLAGAESQTLDIHRRVMQNTLEQLVWFVLSLLGLATLLKPHEFHIIPVLSLCFVFGRLVYWRGYFMNGTLGRRFGVQISFTLNIGLMVLTACLLFMRT